MNGRGAWPANGAGGTKKYKDASRPGSYYFYGSGAKPEGRSRTADEYAVYRAIKAYQKALNKYFGRKALEVDGYFGVQTQDAVFQFQTYNPQTGRPWGGIGPDTSKALLRPALDKVMAKVDNPMITANMVSGTINHESMWDAGAVGYTDPDDLGLAQINGRAHPDLSRAQRLTPSTAFQFIVDYYSISLAQLAGNQRDAVAAYNLGVGGARTWIRAGRPDIWTPAGSTTPRNVKGYIDNILEG